MSGGGAGGIPLRSRRGPVGENWWAIELREALEYLIGRRWAQTGKAVARRGAVQWVEVSPGHVTGAVTDAGRDAGRGADGGAERAAGRSTGRDAQRGDGRGGEATARLEWMPLSGSDRVRASRAFSGHPEIRAQVLAGALPRAVDDELREEDIELVPRGARGMTFDCSCPDGWPGPCRHVAALAYVLVELVDSEPVKLLEWRGIDLAAAASGDVPEAVEGGRAGAPRFDPRAADPGVLVEVLGEQASLLLGSFYAAAPALPDRDR